MERVNLLENEWAFMVDGTEHLRKTMAEACSDLPVEIKDGEEYVSIKYRDFKKLMEFYMREHSGDLPF